MDHLWFECLYVPMKKLFKKCDIQWEIFRFFGNYQLTLFLYTWECTKIHVKTVSFSWTCLTSIYKIFLFGLWFIIFDKFILYESSTYIDVVLHVCCVIIIHGAEGKDTSFNGLKCFQCSTMRYSKKINTPIIRFMYWMVSLSSFWDLNGWLTWIPSTQRYISPSLVEIGPVVLEQDCLDSSMV